MSENKSKFDIWWNLPETKKKIGAVYSLGASVVIIGAMFKILHLPGAGYILGVGMSVEAFLFALGVFDQPHKEYEWEKIYDFENGGNMGELTEPSTPVVVEGRKPSVSFNETMKDDDVKKLTEGIKNLTITAQQLSELSTVATSAGQLSKTLNNATTVTDKFIAGQETLSNSTEQLKASYQGIIGGMDAVEKNTKVYAGKLDDINKNLSTINAIYEIQFKNIQAQSESLNKQTEGLNNVTNSISEINKEVQKIKSDSTDASKQAESFKNESTKLSKQIAELNQIYGNMLNALS